MRVLWFLIYNAAGVPILRLFFRFYGLFNSKVREGLKSRRDLFGSLNKSLSLFEENPETRKNKNVLIHSSSLGEYQQAIPLVEQFNKKNYNVILSFFSPSGYRNAKISYPDAVKTYLPLDSYRNAGKFLDIVNPGIIIFMRYDLWFNLLYIANKRGIKTVMANARYDEKDLTWKIPVISSFKKKLYGLINTIFVIDETDEANYSSRLKTEDTEIIKIGDSKFERVYESAKNIVVNDIIPEEIIKGKKIFVMGSSWKEDEDIILPALDKAVTINRELLIFLVPHEPKETKISAIEKMTESRYKNLKHIRYTRLKNYSGENLIIVDRIGILSKLYSTAYLSYVGGGFKTGLHNILEPAIFNMPILFSNSVKNSDEDEILVKNGCGIIITDTKQFYRIFRKFMEDRKYRDETGEKCRTVFKDSVGIAEKIVNRITE